MREPKSLVLPLHHRVRALPAGPYLRLTTAKAELLQLDGQIDAHLQYIFGQVDRDGSKVQNPFDADRHAATKRVRPEWHLNFCKSLCGTTLVTVARLRHQLVWLRTPLLHARLIAIGPISYDVRGDRF